ncbi:MAG TPA: cyanophycin synthetase, partial [Candidatus Saccharimonadales bacterium]|nr:cyanophycin synthetase [Candidatus Saccharimonadales bacterium]
FGYLVETATKLVVVNGDQEDILAQLKRIKPSVKVEKVSVSALKGYEINKGKTTYIINEKTITLPGLHPEVLAISLQLVNHLLQYLDILFDPTYKNFHLPPGRSSVFKGKKDVTIIDSTYNSNLASLTAILNLFNKYSADKKWLVLGDMLEQGNLEESEHQKFAEEVIKTKADNIILLGPRTKKYVYPILKSELKVPIQTFNGPTEVYDFLRMNIKGGETILFKGGRSLEGVIELLLADPGDAKYLVRREKYWVKQRQKRGLPK